MQERELLAMEISSLKSALTSDASEVGDWKVVKCYEYFLAGEEAPYDVEKLHKDRQEIRDKINGLQERLDKLELLAPYESGENFGE